MKTKLLIIGAGPYGLSIAAYAKRQNIEFMILGKPMGFWEQMMPQEMILRSGVDWHLDVMNELTFEQFVHKHDRLHCLDSPIPKKDFLDYAHWFRKQSGLTIMDERVVQLDVMEGGYVAKLESGSSIEADKVVVATGFEYFKNIPGGLVDNIPGKYYGHSCDVVNFNFLKGKRCVILGGRQAAFEWAALAFDNGCDEVVMVFDHEVPDFVHSDWGWVDVLIENSLEHKGWFSSLPKEERESIQTAFWGEGRLKLEPWLDERLIGKNISIYPNNGIGKIEESNSSLSIYLKTGERLETDYMILATGYKPDLDKIPFLKQGNTIDRIETENAFPKLNHSFECSVPGLYFTSYASMASFGPFCGFVKGAPMTAKIIVDSMV